MSSDAQRLADAREVLAGEERQRSQNAVYVVYVAVIAAGAYGVPAAQALLRFVDPQWLASHLGGFRGVLLGVAVLVAALALAYRLGRVRELTGLDPRVPQESALLVLGLGLPAAADCPGEE